MNVSVNNTLAQEVTQWVNMKHLEITLRILQVICKQNSVSVVQRQRFAELLWLQSQVLSKLLPNFYADTNACFEFN